VTQQFKAADQQIHEAGNLIILVVTVDADEPEAGDWQVSYLAPVVAQPGKGHHHQADLARRTGASRSLSLCCTRARLAPWGRAPHAPQLPASGRTGIAELRRLT